MNANSDLSENTITINELKEINNFLERTITGLNNEAAQINNDQREAKKLNVHIHQQNDSLQECKSNHEDTINQLNTEISSLTEIINSLEADEQQVNRRIQQKSIAISSMNATNNEQRPNNGDNTNITTNTIDSINKYPP